MLAHGNAKRRRIINVKALSYAEISKSWVVARGYRLEVKAVLLLRRYHSTVVSAAAGLAEEKWRLFERGRRTTL